MNPHISIYNAQLIWAPMRIGFVLTLGLCLLYFLINLTQIIKFYFYT